MEEIKKICSKCGEEKPINEFAYQGGICKKCRADYMKEYRINYYNKDEIKERLKIKSKLYYKINKEEIKNRSKQYYEQNKQKCLIENKKWKEKRLKENPNYYKEKYESYKLIVGYTEKQNEKRRENYSKNIDYEREKRKTYRKNNPEKVRLSYLKWRRLNPEKHGLNVKKYRENHPEKVLEWTIKRINGLMDNYVAQRIHKVTGMPHEEIYLNPELIETNRNIIKIKRIINQIKTKTNDKLNTTKQ